MLYLLLIIIAVGVLLISEAGQWLLAIAGTVYLGFWILVITIGLFSDKSIRTFIGGVMLGVIFAGYAIYGIYKIYWGFISGDYSIKKIGRSTKSWFIKEWKEHRVSVIFCILLFSFTAIMIAWAIMATYER